MTNPDRAVIVEGYAPNPTAIRDDDVRGAYRGVTRECGGDRIGQTAIRETARCVGRQRHRRKQKWNGCAGAQDLREPGALLEPCAEVPRLPGREVVTNETQAMDA